MAIYHPGVAAMILFLSLLTVATGRARLPVLSVPLIKFRVLLVAGGKTMSWAGVERSS